MVSRMPHPKRQPIILPGFDRQTQLTLEFATIKFGAIWLRRIYTNEADPSIQLGLAAEGLSAEEYNSREHRLQEVRYGNNITVLFKACFSSRIFHGSHCFWTAISRGFGARPEVVKAVADLFIEARAIYLRNNPAAYKHAPLVTEATYWVDKWTSPLRERTDPMPGSDNDVFKAVDDFFKKEKAANGDLACILSKRTAIEAPRGPRKRSSSPNVLQFQDESYFGLKIRGQALRENRNSPSHHFVAEQYEMLDRVNNELQERVDILEREKVEAAMAQKDRDDAIRMLQIQCATFEKMFAAADAQSSVNGKMAQEMQVMMGNVASQGEKLQKMGAQLERSNEITQEMQATISSLQNKLTAQAQSTGQGRMARGPQTTLTATETEMVNDVDSGGEKREHLDMRLSTMFLEVQSSLLQEEVDEMRRQIAASKDKAVASNSESAQEPRIQDSSTRLRAIEEGMERHFQAAQGVTDRVLALGDQAVTSIHARIATLESQPDPTQEISKLETRVSSVEENQINHLDVNARMVDDLQTRFEEMIKELSKRVDEVGSLPLTKAISDGVAEIQARLAAVEEHGIETSRRLDDMEVSHDALMLQDQSSRIDGLSQSLKSMENLLFGLARSDDVQALRAEFNTLSQTQSIANQPTGQGHSSLATLNSAIDCLSSRMARLEDAYETFTSESRNRLEQLSSTSVNPVQDGELNNTSIVVDSLCQRIRVIENGFQTLRDVMCSRRR
ncbi:hypothetical protein J7T55_003372 [Diaporthe amygdali]|uniref:uncharacterized protein n=1 Tax=Phomopsis amygdali TaxID=1214568 RepID=UPI0022FDF474|nr:uncharacterized protein J7T55_003372 [Diaporthe amygdali]KAJ0116958.1 hypothetical protein J7T55_003372 [Diaporthe amygdali]